MVGALFKCTTSNSEMRWLLLCRRLQPSNYQFGFHNPHDENQLNTMSGPNFWIACRCIMVDFGGVFDPVLRALSTSSIGCFPNFYSLTPLNQTQYNALCIGNPLNIHCTITVRKVWKHCLVGVSLNDYKDNDHARGFEKSSQSEPSYHHYQMDCCRC